MKQASIVAYGLDSSLTERVRSAAQPHDAGLREAQNVRACRGLLARGWPLVLVLTLGKDLAEELTLLQEASQASPGTAIIALCDTANPALVALAWDLGAHCVLQPPLPMEMLPEMVTRFLGQDKLAGGAA